MSLPHYFLSDQVLSCETAACFALKITPDDVKHMKVARFAPGEHLAVIDASNDYFECEMVEFTNGVPYVRICKKLEAKAALPHISLVQGLAKGEKMDLVIRHATELGVLQFIPLVCQRCVVKLDSKRQAARVQRWNAIAKSAAMQSGQTQLAQVQEPLSVARFAQIMNTFDAVLVCWEEAPLSLPLSKAVQEFTQVDTNALSDLKIAIVVGPEGGLTSCEVDTLLSVNNAHLVSLGSSILRTETAGIVAPALVLYSLGQLGGPATKPSSETI